MSAWLSVTKAVLPYISDIITVAAPVFTRRKGSTGESQMQILQQQVLELQNASLQNSGDTKALAEQLKTALPLLEQEIRKVDTRLLWAKWMSVFAVVVAVLALIASSMVLWGK